MCQFCSPVKYCVPPVGTEPPSPPLGAGHGWQVKKTRVNGKTDFNSISDRYSQTFSSDYFFNSNNH